MALGGVAYTRGNVTVTIQPHPETENKKKFNVLNKEKVYIGTERLRKSGTKCKAVKHSVRPLRPPLVAKESKTFLSPIALETERQSLD